LHKNLELIAKIKKY
jgi:hypothetical protein